MPSSVTLASRSPARTPAQPPAGAAPAAARSVPGLGRVPVAAWLAFFGYKLGSAVIGPVAIWNDSYTYNAVANQSVLSRSFWWGPKPPLLGLLWRLATSPRSFAVVMALASALAWGVLAWSLALSVRPGWPRVVAPCLLLAFAAAPIVSLWDWSILSESPAISALAAVLASGLWITRTGRSDLAWKALAPSLACFVLVRDEDIWAAGLAGVVLVVLAVVVAIRTRASSAAPGPSGRSMLSKSPTARALPLVALVVVGLVMASAVLSIWSHRGVVSVKDSLVVRVFPYPDRVAWFAAHGMPDGARIDRLARARPRDPGVAPVVAPPAERTWVGLTRWIHNDGQRVYAEFLISHPGYDLTAPFSDPPLTFNNAGGHLAAYGALGHHPLGWLEVSLVPGYPCVIGLAGVWLVVALVRRSWRSLQFWFWTGMAVVGVVSMFIAWHGEGMEVARHLVEAEIQVRVAVLCGLVTAVVGAAGPVCTARVAACSNSDRDLAPIQA